LKSQQYHAESHNKEKEKVYNKEYKASHKTIIKAARKEYNIHNKSAKNEYDKEYYNQNKESIKKRRLEKNSNPVSTASTNWATCNKFASSNSSTKEDCNTNSGIESNDNEDFSFNVESVNPENEALKKHINDLKMSFAHCNTVGSRYNKFR
jgi:hypothetical protein